MGERLQTARWDGNIPDVGWEQRDRVTDHIHDGVAVVDQSGIILYASHSFENIVCPEPDWGTGKAILHRVHPEDTEDVHKKFLDAVQQRKTFCIEYRYEKEDGMYIFIEAQGVPVVNRFGAVEYIWFKWQDISVRKDLEIQLSQTKQRHASLFDYNSDCVFSLDLDGKFTEVNQACGQISSYTRDELLAMHFHPLIVPDDLERVVDEFHRTCQGEVRSYSCTLLHRSGKRVELNVTNLPIRVDGGIVGIYGIAKDVTELKRKQNLLVGQKMILERIASGASLLPTLEMISNLATDNFSQCKASISYPLERAKNDDRHLTEHTRNGLLRPRVTPMLNIDIENDYGDKFFTLEFAARGQKGTFVMDMRDVESPTREEVSMFQTYCDLAKLAFTREIYMRKLTQMANTDFLTGITNRHYFVEQLDEAIQARSTIGLIFIDIDRFKWINDTLGHAFGDKVLVEYAKRVKQCLSPNDILGRLGGDEFSLMLANVETEEQVQAVAEKIVELSNQPMEIDGHSLRITASLGIALFPFAGKDQASLFNSLDAALYKAKSVGRNNYQSFSPDMVRVTYERLVLERELQNALQNNDLQIVYQPKFDIQQRRMSGVEALIRWTHPTKGGIPPSTFIPLAEQTGLILPIELWVIDEVCRQAKKWEEDGTPIRVSINISQLHFQHTQFVERLEQRLSLNGVQPHLIDIEITETALMQQTDEFVLLRKLQDLNKLGVTVSLDDFGIGYSSLGLLRKFPVNYLKIDQSFVRDHDKQGIVEAIIQLGHSLGMKVVAEGVEELSELKFLQRQGCDEVQGFLLSRPMTPDSLSVLVGSKFLNIGGDGEWAY